MRIPRINVYLPDELAHAAKEQGLNVSALTQEAITAQLRAHATGRWLVRLDAPPDHSASHDDVIAALDAVRDGMPAQDG